MGLRHLLSQLVLKQLTPPQAKNNGDFLNNTYMDLSGLGSVMVVFQVGTTDAAVGSTDEATPPILEECDTYDGSYSAITAAALSTVIGAGDDDTLHGIIVDLTKSHKRYLRVKAPHAANATAANMAILAIGFPANHGPMTGAQMGLHELIQA
jgi:hypothetical protein